MSNSDRGTRVVHLEGEFDASASIMERAFSALIRVATAVLVESGDGLAIDEDFVRDRVSIARGKRTQDEELQ